MGDDRNDIMNMISIFCKLQRYSVLAEVTFCLGLYDKTAECIRGIFEQSALVSEVLDSKTIKGEENAKEKSHDEAAAETDATKQSGSKTVAENGLE